jgi:hypothetical protein
VWYTNVQLNIIYAELSTVRSGLGWSELHGYKFIFPPVDLDEWIITLCLYSIGTKVKGSSANARLQEMKQPVTSDTDICIC